MASNEEGSKFLTELPYEEFLSLVKDDNLKVKEEIVVVKAIDRYMNLRRTLPQPIEVAVVKEEPKKEV